jgi:hypothetical protein
MVKMVVMDIFRWKKWQGQKLYAAFWPATTFCSLLLLVALYCDSDGVLTPFGNIFSTTSSQQEKNFEISSGSKQPQQREGDVKLVKEWEWPSVTADRPNEELNDSDSFAQPRRYMPLGSAAFLFIQFGAYRTGPNEFAVVGLGPKGLHKEGNPGFECGWASTGDNSTVQGKASKKTPDWGLGRQYSTVVVHCIFGTEVGAKRDGGRLELVAKHGSSDHTGLPDVNWVALIEEPNQYNRTKFVSPYKYDYLYCGSPIFGSISPQKIREWIAYHVWLFGPRAHFILYDAGGINEGVRRILEPWVRRGSVTVLNIRQESRYDQYYYSQFLVVNDCLFQAKSLAKWTFYFDVDEYIHVPEPFTFDQVMLEYNSMGRRAQQVHFKQNFMSHFHCRNESLDAGALKR